MQVDVKIPARFGSILTKQASVIRLVNCSLQAARLIHKFAADIDIGGMRPHRKTSNHTALKQLVWLMADNVAVLACTWLGLIGIDDEVMRTILDFLGHERPFQPGRKASAAPSTQARSLHPLDDLVRAQLEQLRRIRPVTPLRGPLEASITPPIDVGENTICILKHWPLPIVSVSASQGWLPHLLPQTPNDQLLSRQEAAHPPQASQAGQRWWHSRDLHRNHH